MGNRNRIGIGLRLSYRHARIHRLAGRYDNSVPTRFLAPIDCSKIPALVSNMPAMQDRNSMRRWCKLWKGTFSLESHLFLAHSCHLAYSWALVLWNCSRATLIFKVHFSVCLGLICTWSVVTRAWARICKCLWSSGIDAEESISPAYVAWRAGTANRVVVLARQGGNRF